MHLIYLDESGQTGTNLKDSAQPVFVLGALIVSESCWLALEKDFQTAVDKSFPSPRPDKFEIHAAELRNPRDSFLKCYPVAHRLSFRDEWLKIAQKHSLKFVYRAISKKRFAAYVDSTFPSGVEINPHVAAFPLIARVVNDYLKALPSCLWESLSLTSAVSRPISKRPFDFFAQRILICAWGRSLKKAFSLNRKKVWCSSYVTFAFTLLGSWRSKKTGSRFGTLTCLESRSSSRYYTLAMNGFRMSMPGLYNKKRSGQGLKPRARIWSEPL
jgi:hypothetical protein